MGVVHSLRPDGRVDGNVGELSTSTYLCWQHDSPPSYPYIGDPRRLIDTHPSDLDDCHQATTSLIYPY